MALMAAAAVPAAAIASPRAEEDERTSRSVSKRKAPQSTARAAADRRLDLLAHRTRAGDGAAAAEMCGICVQLLQSYFRRSLRNSHEAEEATQHVMLKLLAALPRYR